MLLALAVQLVEHFVGDANLVLEDLVLPDGRRVTVDGYGCLLQRDVCVPGSGEGCVPKDVGRELDYLHDGVAWRQTHRLVKLAGEQICVVTVQSPEGLVNLAEAAAEEVAGSLIPHRSG